MAEIPLKKLIADKSRILREARTYVTMAGKSIGKCSSGHWLPLRGDCDLCCAGPDQKCRFINPEETHV